MSDQTTTLDHTPAPNLVREVVAVFHDAGQLEAAVDALEAAGVLQTNISIMADPETIASTLGHRFAPVAEMADDPNVPRRAFVGRADRAVRESAALGLPLYIGAMAGALTVVASGGAAAMALLGAAAGGAVGGGFGGVLARFIGQRAADRLEDAIRRGGILIWVAVGNAAAEARVIALLKAAGGTEVHAHEIAQTWERAEIPFKDWNPDPFLV